jgi:DNA-binding IclR family transcriptional regulator
MSAVPAVEQTIAILTYLISAPGFKANLTDIAKAVGIYKSKAQAILNTLQRHRWVSRDIEDKLYSLGLGMIPYGRRALENIDYRELAKPFLVELAQETRCTTQFSVISDEHMVVVAVEESGELLDSRNKVGFVFPLFEKAHGKVLLAFMHDEERERVLAGGKFNLGGRSTGANLDRLRQEIAECRKKGFSVDLDISIPMIKVMASPVLGVTRYPIGALFIVGVFAKSAVRKYGAKLRETAKRLSALFEADVLVGEKS